MEEQRFAHFGRSEAASGRMVCAKGDRTKLEHFVNATAPNHWNCDETGAQRVARVLAVAFEPFLLLLTALR